MRFISLLFFGFILGANPAASAGMKKNDRKSARGAYKVVTDCELILRGIDEPPSLRPTNLTPVVGDVNIVDHERALEADYQRIINQLPLDMTAGQLHFVSRLLNFDESSISFIYRLSGKFRGVEVDSYFVLLARQKIYGERLRLFDEAVQGDLDFGLFVLVNNDRQYLDDVVSFPGSYSRRN